MCRGILDEPRAWGTPGRRGPPRGALPRRRVMPLVNEDAAQRSPAEPATRRYLNLPPGRTLTFPSTRRGWPTGRGGAERMTFNLNESRRRGAGRGPVAQCPTTRYVVAVVAALPACCQPGLLGTSSATTPLRWFELTPRQPASGCFLSLPAATAQRRVRATRSDLHRSSQRRRSSYSLPRQIRLCCRAQCRPGPVARSRR